jgi:hypothetical protein
MNDICGPADASEHPSTSYSQASSSRHFTPVQDIRLGMEGFRKLTTTGLSGTMLTAIIDSLEICEICGMLFTATALRAHIVGCVEAREAEGGVGPYIDDEVAEVEETVTYQGKGKGKALE